MTNLQYEKVEKLARQKLKPNECPTCHSQLEEAEPGVEFRKNGTYKLHDQEYSCDCETQISLYRHYLLAGIGEQYMRLDWSEFTGSESAKEAVSAFINNWDGFKQHGLGIEFSSPKLGVGKTFAATYIGRTLIKDGEQVLFVPFLDVIGGYNRHDAEEFDDRLRSTTWLILDEVVPPWSTPQGHLFASSFEALVRHRQNHNLPIIMTTNLTSDDLQEHYPRTYSLLAAKQWRVEMGGDDYRHKIDLENLELAINKEVRPIV